MITYECERCKSTETINEFHKLPHGWTYLNELSHTDIICASCYADYNKKLEKMNNRHSFEVTNFYKAFMNGD